MEKDLCASGIVILLFLVAMLALALLYSTLLSLSEWVSVWCSEQNKIYFLQQQSTQRLS